MALRDVNLIPPDMLNRRYAFRHVCLWGVFLIMAVGLLSGYYVYQRSGLNGSLTPGVATGVLSDLESKLNTQAAQIKQAQAELKQLEALGSTFAHIKGLPRYYRILAGITRVMNENTWLTHLGLANDPESENRAHVKINGMTYSSEGLGDLLNRLAGEPMFEAVALNYAQETVDPHSTGGKAEPLKVIRFEIQCKT